jgi:hypothetical protein
VDSSDDRAHTVLRESGASHLENRSTHQSVNASTRYPEDCRVTPLPSQRHRNTGHLLNHGTDIDLPLPNGTIVPKLHLSQANLSFIHKRATKDVLGQGIGVSNLVMGVDANPRGQESPLNLALVHFPSPWLTHKRPYRVGERSQWPEA